MPQWLAWTVLVAATATLGLLLPMALHRSFLMLLAGRRRGERELWRGPLPRVTVQLPVFNEAGVVERLVDAAASFDYPKERLEIQLLDDSTDETAELGRRRVEYWRRRGVRIEQLRRNTRDGFKAGALARGLERANGEFILILDADFLPEPDLIHRLLGPLDDPGVGMVQARWDHLNEERSLLTRCQALLLDAHFFFEQGGRWAGGRFMSFNGTAGMWRRVALEEAGGWSSDTLTEDLDASYRAQMKGWRFVFRPATGVAAELPEEMRSLEVQQQRWSQGGIETGRKLIPTLLRGPWPLAVKVEAVFHLFGHLAHPLTLLFALLLLPTSIAWGALDMDPALPLDLLVFAGATLSLLGFYCAAGRRRDRPWRTLLPTALCTMALGIGLTATVSGAVLRGVWGRGGDLFHRTPKRGSGRRRYTSAGLGSDLALKLILVAWMTASAIVAVQERFYTALPFILLFGFGYAWVAFAEIRDRFRSLAPSEGAIPEPVPVELSTVGSP